jgi:hypothetical protein
MYKLHMYEIRDAVRRRQELKDCHSLKAKSFVPESARDSPPNSAGKGGGGKSNVPSASHRPFSIAESVHAPAGSVNR